MEHQEILEQVQEIFRDILDVADLELTQFTTPADVEGWDSLSHIQLIFGTEKHFGIRFTSEEIFEWQNVGDMIKNIEDKNV